MKEKRMSILKVNEIFKSIQGESTLAGQPTIFIRLQGCNLRCPWCDTKYSWKEDKGELMKIGEIHKELNDVGLTGFVCITGGEPLLQREGVKELVDGLITEGQIVSVETNGGVDIGGFENVHKIVMDWKGPSAFDSKEKQDVYNRMVMANVNVLKERQLNNIYHDEIKFLVSDRRDWLFAKECMYYLAGELTRKYVKGVFVPTILVSPIIPRGDKPEVIRNLAEWMVADSSGRYIEVLRPRYQLQIHKYIWPDVMRGV